MKNLIRKLYHKYCTRPVEAFTHEEKQLTKKRELQIYTECKHMVDLGVLRQVIEMEVAQSETRQLYEASNVPFKITEAELYRWERRGIENLWNRIKIFSNKLPKPEKVVEKYSIT